jgi:glyoxylase-like metal-dependent hydrolase (beta-lactamase superfamily II)
MKPIRTLVLLVLCLTWGPRPLLAADLARPPRDGFWQPDKTRFPDLFAWSDTCNVYLLREGEAALLIDVGDGSILDRLADLGVKRVEWVLFTHHHREQCQGAPLLKAWNAKIGVPEAERAFFERPTDFRKMNVRLGDAFTIHGSSFVRPPIQSIPVERAFKSPDTFTWHGHEFRCVDTRGNSPGGMTYLLSVPGRTPPSPPTPLPSDGRGEPGSPLTPRPADGRGEIAFSGDVMLAGAKMHTWFDTEWDYGFAAGIQALRKSVARLAEAGPEWLLPAHGPVVRDPKPELREFGEKLARLEPLYLRGYGVEGASVAYQDKVSKPTVISNVWQVTPHVFKFKRPNFWPNFGLILSESGRGLVVDCGLLDVRFLDQSLEGLREHFGLKAIDAMVITHMHGDHFLEAPHLRQKWGAKIWALENMVDKMEHPEWFDYAAPIQAYGHGFDGVRVDRALKPGETFQWEGYTFTVDWMPGQTEFALCLHGQIDGRQVAFTGDNIFGDPTDASQNGHEAMVAHNSAILEEGYIYGAEYLKRLQPDIMVGGHSFVMGQPAGFIERFRQWSYQMREAFQSLSSESDYRYWFDPFWVRAQPYRVSVRPGESAEVQLHVRNFLKTTQAHRIHVHLPEGLTAEPAVLEGRLDAETRRAFPFRIKAAAGAAAGVRLVAFDVTLDGRRFGERFDMFVQIAPGGK